MTSEPELETAAAGPEPAAPAAVSVVDGVHHALDPRSISLDRLVHALANVVVAALLAGGLAVLAAVGPLPDGSALWLGAAWLVVAVGLAWHAWSWPPLDYRHTSYRVAPDEVEIRRGVLWRTVINVPRSRVQHTDVAQGPWQRRFGLAKLAIYTAGMAHARVSLSGLAHERALLIREHLLPRDVRDVI